VATPDPASSSRVAAGQTCDEGFKNSHHAVDNDHQYAGDATYDDHNTIADSCKGRLDARYDCTHSDLCLLTSIICLAEGVWLTVYFPAGEV